MSMIECGNYKNIQVSLSIEIWVKLLFNIFYLQNNQSVNPPTFCLTWRHFWSAFFVPFIIIILVYYYSHIFLYKKKRDTHTHTHRQTLCFVKFIIKMHLILFIFDFKTKKCSLFYRVAGLWDNLAYS